MNLPIDCKARSEASTPVIAAYSCVLTKLYAPRAMLTRECMIRSMRAMREKGDIFFFAFFLVIE